MNRLFGTSWSAISLLLVASMLVTGCTLLPTNRPIATELSVATETLPASQATATLAPAMTTVSALPSPSATQPPPTSTATMLPTVTPLPTTPPTAAPSATPPPIRISFAPGATSAVVEGNLAAHGAQTYILGAVANQLLDVSVTPDTGIRLSIYGADGMVLRSGMGEGAFFRGTLPSSQDYILALAAGDAATAFAMNVVIPARISFAPGTTSAVVAGNLAANGIQHYLLAVEANQLLEVSVTPETAVRLSIYGVDGTVLMSGMGGGGFFRGYVPSSQDYIVALAAGGAATAYTMNVIIPARISFAPGATSAVVEGNLAAHGAQTYILGAAANQLLEVSVSPDTGVRLSIYGVDGTVLASGMGEGASFRGTLPSTQDYILALAAGDAATAYTVSVIIPERISFAPGGISATLQGNLAAFGSHSYILGASAGQEMEVNVTPEGSVRLSIYGVDGTVLASGMGEGSSFTGTLPSTQDYILDLFAGDHAVAYTLQVTIP